MKKLRGSRPHSEGFIKIHDRPDRPEISAPHLEQARELSTLIVSNPELLNSE
jgi:hypothetical protein